MMSILKSFLAGFVSTLVFHQGGLALLHAAGASDRSAFPMNPVTTVFRPFLLMLTMTAGLIYWLSMIRPQNSVTTIKATELLKKSVINQVSL